MSREKKQMRQMNKANTEYKEQYDKAQRKIGRKLGTSTLMHRVLGAGMVGAGITLAMLHPKDETPTQADARYVAETVLIATPLVGGANRLRAAAGARRQVVDLRSPGWDVLPKEMTDVDGSGNKLPRGEVTGLNPGLQGIMHMTTLVLDGAGAYLLASEATGDTVIGTGHTTDLVAGALSLGAALVHHVKEGGRNDGLIYKTRSAAMRAASMFQPSTPGTSAMSQQQSWMRDTQPSPPYPGLMPNQHAGYLPYVPPGYAQNPYGQYPQR